MSGRAIQITVLQLKPGLETFVIPELAPIIESTRQMGGCLVFDLYRLSENQSTLALHEVWKTREALAAYDLSPLRTEVMSLVNRFLIAPPRFWAIEEVC